MPLRTQRAALEVVHDRLTDTYGCPQPSRALPALDELILTILSQNTTDTNRDRAWERLKARFADWEDVAAAPREKVEAALEVGGLHRVKARRIQEILEGIRADHGVLDLEHLRRVGIDAARSELSAIKGLGAKSVNCILLFALGYAAFPVDTHVFRVLARIGVHRAKDLTRANNELQAAVPAPICFPLHMSVIRHGREVCHARRPQCFQCCLADVCGYQQKVAASS